MDNEESLLTGNDTQNETQTETTQTEVSPWAYADGINGEGDKPEWFNDSKYKSIATSL